MEHFVVTVARGFGSGGKEIAAKVAESYEIECYEKRILTLTSQLSGIEEEEMNEVDEKLRDFSFGAMLKSFPIFRRSDEKLNKFVSDQLLFEYQAKIIRDLAKKESCVIVGKCADYVLRDYKNVVRVYIEAPRKYTRERIMRIQKVPAETADNLITRTDQYRAAYYEAYTGGNYWTNPVNYDITLNSSTLGIDGCVEMIKNCMHVKLGDSCAPQVQREE
ncbi:MAG: cytidylate kinase-like family protein [Clostridiales bacterium]|nr:cytidylate kinase-like family protein [Clostridiales bacterium]